MKAHAKGIQTLAQNKGLTLIELMVVVAIIGILAALAGVAYFKQIKNAKMMKLEQYAMELSTGQEDFYSRHNVYFPIDNSQIPTFNGTDPQNTSGARFTLKQVMGFDHAELPEDVTIMLSAGQPGETCHVSVCTNGVMPDTTTTWFAVRVEQDLNPSETENTAIIITSSMPNPIRVNEGM